MHTCSLSHLHHEVLIFTSLTPLSRSVGEFFQRHFGKEVLYSLQYNRFIPAILTSRGSFIFCLNFEMRPDFYIEVFDYH